MKVKNRLQRIEHLAALKNMGSITANFSISPEEAEAIYNKITQDSSPLYIKEGGSYVNILELSGIKLAQSYREYAQGHIDVYSADELKAMGVEGRI